MAISFGAAGSVVTGTGASVVLSPTPPSSTSNSINFLVVTWKSSSIAEPVIATTLGTWTKLALSDSAVDVASGLDVGSTSTVVYYSLGTAPTGTTATFSGTVGVGQAVIINYTKGATEAFTVSSSTGSDESNGANYSATTNLNFSAVTADWLIAFTGTNSDVAGHSARAITATGLTLSAVNSRVTSLSATGDDSGLLIDDHSVSSGTQSAAAVYSYTNVSSTQGTTVICRLRVTTVPAVSVAVINDFAEVAGYRVTVTGLTGFAQFRVTATDDSGVFPERDVRGGHLQTVSGSSFVGDDYEFSFGNTGVSFSPTVTYKAYVYSGGIVVGFGSDTIDQSPLDEWNDSLTSTGNTSYEGPVSYISVPLQPALNLPVLIREFNGYDRQGNILSESHVLGRANPVISTDVMSGRKGSFQLIVPESGFPNSLYCGDTVNDYISLFNSGYTLMLRNLSPYAIGIEDFYFVVNSLNVQRLSRVANMVVNNKPVIQITVDWTEVDMPPSDETVSTLTWSQVNDNYQNWSQVLNSNTSWLDVLQNG